MDVLYYLKTQILFLEKSIFCIA